MVSSPTMSLDLQDRLFGRQSARELRSSSLLGLQSGLFRTSLLCSQEAQMQAKSRPNTRRLSRSTWRTRLRASPPATRTASCLPPGMPRVMTMTYPMEITIGPDRIMIYAEWQEQVRRIFTDGRPLPAVRAGPRRAGRTETAQKQPHVGRAALVRDALDGEGVQVVKPSRRASRGRAGARRRPAARPPSRCPCGVPAGSRRPRCRPPPRGARRGRASR